MGFKKQNVILALFVFLIIVVLLVSVKLNTSLKYKKLNLEGNYLLKITEFINPSKYINGIYKYGNFKIYNFKTDKYLKNFIRIKTYRKTEKSYDFQLNFTNYSKVTKGDLIFVRFYTRSPNCLNRATIEFVFERKGGDYRKSIVIPVIAGCKWSKKTFAFYSKDNFNSEEANINLRAGFKKQVVDIAGIEVLNLGKDYPVDKLPYLTEMYSHNNKIIKEAEKNIDKYRKVNAIFKIVDKNNFPIKNVKIHLIQKKHKFLFGGTVNVKVLNDKNIPENMRKKYIDKIFQLFNAVTIENSLKLKYWKGKRKRYADELIKLLENKGFFIRGHYLFSAYDLSEIKEKNYRYFIRENVVKKFKYYGNKIFQWDAVNEPCSTKYLLKKYGIDENFVFDVFSNLKQINPDIQLTLNENSIISSFGRNTDMQKCYYNLIYELKRKKLIDAVGIQAHFDYDLTKLNSVKNILKKISKLNLPVYITELDINSYDDNLQPRFLRDFMTLAFSEKSVRGIILWNWWEKVHNDYYSSLYTDEWKPKKSGIMLENLLLKKWRTDTVVYSDNMGYAENRVFKGYYDIELYLNGVKKKVENILIDENNTEFKIILN